jgi:hypothetical protein
VEGEFAMGGSHDATLIVEDSSGLRAEFALQIVVASGTAGILPIVEIQARSAPTVPLLNATGGIDQIEILFADDTLPLALESMRLVRSNGEMVRNASFTFDQTTSTGTWHFDEFLTTDVFHFGIDLDGDAEIDEEFEFAIPLG